jgi:hypothetical protein
MLKRAHGLVLVAMLSTAEARAELPVKAPAAADLLAFVKRAASEADYQEQLIPIGWSADGKLAFVSISPEMAGAGPVHSYQIVTAANGREVWSLVDDASPDLATSWNRSHSAFAAALDEHAIKPAAAKLLPLPLLLPDGGYACSLATQGKGRNRTTRVRLNTPSKLAKEIGSFPDRGKSFVAGCFKSPIGPHFAVVVGTNEPVMDAATALSFKIFAATLDKAVGGDTPRR